VRPQSPVLRRYAILAQRARAGAVPLEIVLTVAQRIEDPRYIARQSVTLR
jgi:hypothetical protein